MFSIGCTVKDKTTELDSTGQEITQATKSTSSFSKEV